MKGNPFKPVARKDGSISIYSKSSNFQGIEKPIKEKYFSNNGIRNLDQLRPDGYKDNVWYEVKIGSDFPMQGWGKASRYFPNIYFPPYSINVDDQIEKYVKYGYRTLKVIVFSPEGKPLAERIFKSEGDLL